MNTISDENWDLPKQPSKIFSPDMVVRNKRKFRGNGICRCCQEKRFGAEQLQVINPRGIVGIEASGLIDNR
jgi:hypothetical protein